MYQKRISIFTGHFGSGKTEVAVNYALQLAAQGKKTIIVDFDIVNPYFRTADAKEALEAQGVRVILPLYANTNVDVPALPAEIYALFQNKEYQVVFDVGGDDLGAKALSRYREEIVTDHYEMFFVANSRRPLTNTPEKIEETIRSIEESSRLTVTSLVNNTHLLSETTVEDVLEGEQILSVVSKRLSIPVSFAAILEDKAKTLEDRTKIPVLPLKKLIRLPWEL